MEKLVFYRDKPIRRTGTTVTRIYAGMYVKAEEISRATGKSISEVVSRLVEFALEHTEIVGCEVEK